MKHHPYLALLTENTKEEDDQEKEDHNLDEELVVLIYFIQSIIFLSQKTHLMHIDTEFPCLIQYKIDLIPLSYEILNPYHIECYSYRLT